MALGWAVMAHQLFGASYRTFSVSHRGASGVDGTWEKLPMELPMEKHGNTTPTRRALDGRMISGTVKRRHQVLEASFK